MYKTIPWPYVAYIRTAIAGITLSGHRLYLEETFEGFVLVKEEGFVPSSFVFPDEWQPPLHAHSREEWVRVFFRGCWLNGHWLRVTEDDDGLFLDEVQGDPGEVYPWVVRFADGWAPPRGLECEVIQPRLPAWCKKEELVQRLVWLYDMDLVDLAALSHEQLAQRIDLAPDMAEVGIYQRKCARQPANGWQKMVWRFAGTPSDWRFEVRVKASPTWQYAVVDTLEEARWVARQAQLRFRWPSPTLVTRYSASQIAVEMRRFLEHCYFTVVSIPFICTPALSCAHVGNRHCRLVKPWRGGTPVAYTLHEPSDWGWDWAGSLSLYLGHVQFTFPVIGGFDFTLLPRTEVTFEPSRLIVHMWQTHNVAGAHDQTVLFVRESPIELSAGERDEHGTYRGE